jgi:hypothetical protein
MAGWESWVALVGGVLAVVGQWWGASAYLPLIGGVLAVVAAVALMSK